MHGDFKRDGVRLGDADSQVPPLDPSAFPSPLGCGLRLSGSCLWFCCYMSESHTDLASLCVLGLCTVESFCSLLVLLLCPRVTAVHVAALPSPCSVALGRVRGHGRHTWSMGKGLLGHLFWALLCGGAEDPWTLALSGRPKRGVARGGQLGGWWLC